MKDVIIREVKKLLYELPDSGLNWLEAYIVHRKTQLGLMSSKIDFFQWKTRSNGMSIL